MFSKHQKHFLVIATTYLISFGQSLKYEMKKNKNKERKKMFVLIDIIFEFVRWMCIEICRDIITNTERAESSSCRSTKMTKCAKRLRSTMPMINIHGNIAPRHVWKKEKTRIYKSCVHEWSQRQVPFSQCVCVFNSIFHLLFLPFDVFKWVF